MNKKTLVAHTSNSQGGEIIEIRQIAKKIDLKSFIPVLSQPLAEPA